MATATLNTKRATKARVDIPAWGCWHAEVTLDGQHTLSGPVELKIADLTLIGTVLSGGPSTDKSRSHFCIVAGAGAWGRTLKKKSYANDAEEKASKILSDAASECGESILASTLPTTRVGPGWVRPAGPACRALELLTPGNWYVGEDGVTRIGARATSAYKGKASHGPVDLASGTVTLAGESIAGILPGITVDGLTAVDVQHTVDGTSLRSTIFGKRGGTTSRALETERKLIEQLFPQLPYLGTWEYLVIAMAGERADLRPVRVSTGMPDLQRVYVRPGVAGAKSTLTVGSRVLVQFLDGSPARPVVVGFEDADGSGFKPLITHIDATTTVRLGLGALPVARGTDLAGGIWPIVPTQTKVLA